MISKAEQFQDWLNDVWRDGKIAEVGRLIAPKANAQGHMINSGNAAVDLEAYIPAMHAVISDTKCDVLRATETEDWLACVVNVTGTGFATGRPVSFLGQVMARFEGGKIVEMYNQFDKAKLLEQLEFLPNDCFAMMLAGESLVKR